MAVFADRATNIGHGLGQRTMPEMAEYSVVTAIYTMWLAARAEGIGMGWISILDPKRLSAMLEIPDTWRSLVIFVSATRRPKAAFPSSNARNGNGVDTRSPSSFAAEPTTAKPGPQRHTTLAPMTTAAGNRRHRRPKDFGARAFLPRVA